MRSKRFFALALCALLFCSLFSLNVFAEEENPLVLTGIPAESGSFQVEIDGELQEEAGEFTVKKGAAVTVKAIPEEGYNFQKWAFPKLPEGVAEESLTDATVSFVMPEERVVLEGHFLEQEGRYTVSIAQNDQGMGSFGHRKFSVGDTVTVEALPYDGYRFKRWLDPAGTLKDLGLPENWDEQSTLTFTMPEKDVGLELQFEPIAYYMTVKVEGQGDVLVAGKTKDKSGKYSINVGDILSISASPGKDFSFIGWAVDNGARLDDYDETSTTVTCPASDFTLTVRFVSSVRTLTIKGGEGGRTQPSPGTMVVGVGNLVSLIATPNEGYSFSHWECSSDQGSFESERDSDTSFIMPDLDCSITPVFVRGGYRLSFISTAGGEIRGKGGIYEMGTKITAEAFAMDGYEFSHWKCNVSGVVKDAKRLKTQIEVPGQDVVVTAVFVLKTTASPGQVLPKDEEQKDFTWLIIALIFVFSAVTITLVILREQRNLSYRYLVGKWYDKLIEKLKRKRFK